METDPRRWIAVLRASHDRLVAYVASLDEEALGRPSMCTDWTVAQVLSHLGSGAEIGRETLGAAVTGRDPAVDLEAVWARWNAMAPRQMATEFAISDRRLVETFEALDDAQLSGLRLSLPFLPEPIDIATLAAFRLNEHALHSWDVVAAIDHGAELAPDAAVLLVDRQPAFVALVGRFLPRETRPADSVTIAVATSDPARRFELDLGDSLALRSLDVDGGPAQLVIPAEALVRLMAGRLRPGWPAAGIEPASGVTMDELRAAFPGY